MSQPYKAPQPTSDEPAHREPVTPVPGRTAIWFIAAVAFCFGAISLCATLLFWRSPELLAGASGSSYYYYALRPLALAVAFLGLSWKCSSYAHKLAHEPLDSIDVRRAHGHVWNWMAMMLAAFMALVAYHSFGG